MINHNLTKIFDSFDCSRENIGLFLGLLFITCYSQRFYGNVPFFGITTFRIKCCWSNKPINNDYNEKAYKIKLNAKTNVPTNRIILAKIIFGKHLHFSARANYFYECVCQIRYNKLQ